MPEEELRPQRCLDHRNGFHHFDPGIAPLESYDLGIKFVDADAPAPGSPSEPRLYLFVSVRDLGSARDCGTITYARSKAFLRDGFPSSELDRRRLALAVVERIERDVRRLASGELETSEEQPILVKDG